jgi:hypothetical protein
VDAVYRELRTLSANIWNASALHIAFENLVNVGFYFVLFLVVLAIQGVNGIEIVYSFSTFIVVFAFAIGPACSQYLEGILLILARRPYGTSIMLLLDIGWHLLLDLIQLSLLPRYRRPY